jgi:serine/threonine protein kinase
MEPPSDVIGPVLGHYRIVEQIGAGGMGVVYRAHDEQLDRDVALKVLPTGTLADDVARKQFRKEALALAKLSHPNIATVFEFSSQEGVDFLVMELIPGKPLSERLHGGAMSQPDIVRLATQLAGRFGGGTRPGSNSWRSQTGKPVCNTGRQAENSRFRAGKAYTHSQRRRCDAQPYSGHR